MRARGGACILSEGVAMPHNTSPAQQRRCWSLNIVTSTSSLSRSTANLRLTTNVRLPSITTNILLTPTSHHHNHPSTLCLPCFVLPRTNICQKLIFQQHPTTACYLLLSFLTTVTILVAGKDTP